MIAGEIIVGALLGSFTCLAPAHDNASTVRCANQTAIIRLIGIDTPAMPTTCKPGQICPPGDPFAAREALRALTLGRPLACEGEGIDGEGRTIARCHVNRIDLSSAMLATGYAIPSKTAGDCNCPTPASRPTPAGSSPAGRAPANRPALLQNTSYRSEPPPNQNLDGRVLAADIVDVDPAPEPLPTAAFAGVPISDTPWSLPVAGAMVMIGLWMAMANLALLQLAHERWPSRQRWGAPMDKLDPWLFLGLAAAGASPAAWTALLTRHAGRQRESLQSRLLTITGLQVGVFIGILWWCFSL